MNNLIPIPTPGEILREEFLDPLDITPYRLAKAMHVPITRIAAVLSGSRSITADTSLRLARALGTSASFWLNLQRDFDVATALEFNGHLFDQVQPLVAQAEPHCIPVIQDEALILTASTIADVQDRVRTGFTVGPLDALEVKPVTFEKKVFS